MLVIPAIDLRDGRCVRLEQGRKDSAKVYEGNPVEVAGAFVAAGARMLHVIDLDGAFGDLSSRNRQVLGELVRATDIPVQFGGGLRAMEDVQQVVSLGAARVVVGTVAVESPDTLLKMLRLFGSKRIAVGIDARNGRVATRGWEKQEPISALRLVRRVKALGVERVIYTDIERDGTLTGPNIDQTCMIAGAGLRVTSSGGISSLADLAALRAVSSCGIDSVIVGKALYEGRFTLSEAIAVAE